MTLQTLEKASLNTYTFIKELGRGTSSVVYLAHDTRLKRYVAIKHLTLNSESGDSFNKEIINNFIREAVTMANLHHEKIVNIYNIVREEHEYYLIMEYIEGVSLSRILKLHELPLDMSLNIIMQVCDALDYMHKNGVIHRDIKPDNIALLGQGLIKLLDFGFAKKLRLRNGKFSNNTDTGINTGDLIGTILYMSPEQLQNSDEVDEKADIYSLAVSLYEMVTGKVPFYGHGIAEVVIKIMGGNPLPPSIVNPCLPRCLDKIILKGMSKDAKNRYSKISEFSEEIRSFLEYQTRMEMLRINLPDKKTKPLND